jgi:ankyrin repeat protein
MNRKHLNEGGRDADGEEREIRKKELLRLYKKATENEKVLAAQRTRKLTLLEAVVSGDTPMVRHLLDNLADMQTNDESEAAPLSEAMLRAAKDGNISVVSLLIVKGAAVDVEGRQSETPMLLAAQNGHEDIVKYLVEHGATVDLKDFVHETPLSWAAKNGHEDIVKYLVEKRATVDLKGYLGKTPLSWATQNGHKDIVKYLVEKGATVDLKDSLGKTPLS